MAEESTPVSPQTSSRFGFRLTPGKSKPQNASLSPVQHLSSVTEEKTATHPAKVATTIRVQKATLNSVASSSNAHLLNKVDIHQVKASHGMAKPPSMLTRARRPVTRSAVAKPASATSKKSTQLSSRIKLAARTRKARDTSHSMLSSSLLEPPRATATSMPAASLADDPSESKESTIVTLSQLFQTCFDRYHDDMNELMGVRIISRKFDHTAQLSQQTALIRRCKLALKQTMEADRENRHLALLLQGKEQSRIEALVRQASLDATAAESASERVHEYKQTVTTLTRQVSEAVAAKDALAAETKAAMLEQKETLQARLTLESEKNELKLALASKNSEAEAREGTMQTLKHQLEAARQEIATLSTSFDTYQESAHVELTRALEVRQTSHTETLQALSMQLVTLESERDSLRTAASTHASDTTRHAESALGLSTRLATEQATVVTLKASLVTSRAACETVTETLRLKESEVTNALEGLTQIQAFTKEANTTLLTEKAALEAKVTALEVSRRDTRSDLSELTHAHARQTAEYTALHANLETLEVTVETLRSASSTVTTDLQEKEMKLAVQMQLNDHFGQQLKEARSEYTAVNAQMEAIRAESKMASTNAALTLTTAHAAYATLEMTLGELKAAHQVTVASLQQEHVGLQSTVDVLRSSARETESSEWKQVCELKSQLDVTKLQLSQAKNAGASVVTANAEYVSELEAKLTQADVLRRQMHNAMQELRGNVRVFARTRPFLPSDNHVVGREGPIMCAADQTTMKLTWQNDKGDPESSSSSSSSAAPLSYGFAFDKVFPPSAGQQDVFDDVSEFVQSAIDGYHVCLFSYGQTGSGKTHTMQGSGTHQMRGIIPRSIEKVLADCTTLSQQGWQYDFTVSFLEIYNDTIRDLLTPSDAAALKKPTVVHQIKHKSVHSKQVYVSDLTLERVDCIEQVASLVERASLSRSVACTDMNAVSSRSHSVFTLHLKGTNQDQGIELNGQLNLVDLAGSERLSRSNATGDRLKETQAINKSLSSLADVFAALGRKSSHVPFRNSKLTYLLQSSLSGDGKTLMMVNLSPTSQSVHESLCSLRFAQQVNQCELGKAKRQVKKCKTATGQRDENSENHPNQESDDGGRSKNFRALKKPASSHRSQNPSSSLPPNKRK